VSEQLIASAVKDHNVTGASPVSDNRRIELSQDEFHGVPFGT
jgi:hypothetical protein